MLLFYRSFIPSPPVPRYVVRAPRDGLWGVEVSPGRWNGMIGEVLQNRALLAAGAFTVNAQRQSVINFTVFIDRQPYNLLTRRPDHLTRALLFLQPFAADVRWVEGMARERVVWVNGLERQW